MKETNDATQFRFSEKPTCKHITLSEDYSHCVAIVFLYILFNISHTKSSFKFPLTILIQSMWDENYFYD
jgi:hypothetical protein